MEPRGPLVRERAFTPTLPLWVISAIPPGRAQRDGVAPHRCPAVHRDQTVAVGPDDREVVARGRGHERRLQSGTVLLAGSLREARGVDHDPAGAEPSGLVDQLGDAAAGVATTTASGAVSEPLRRLGQGREAGEAVRLGATGVHPDEAAVETCEHQIAHRLPAVGRRALGGADHDDAARGEQATEVHQVSMVVTPRFSSARATMIRWISDEPSQMRSTRSSRQYRSAAVVRM